MYGLCLGFQKKHTLISDPRHGTLLLQLMLPFQVTVSSQL